ncbi:MAG: IS3 family transposase [Acidimicrobiales bacterium]|nr:IS3 family transposase [Acidimicrobiales bacterium]
MYTFIAENQADPACEWSVAEMCRTLEVSRSGFYGWQSRPPCQRELDGWMLAREIDAIYEASGRTYGVPRMTRCLQRQGFEVNHKRVARLMRQLGLEGESGRRKVRTTIVDKAATAASDLVGRQFNPPAPDVVWCGDITYLHTGEGWLYLATVIDLYSRRVIGWAAANHMRVELVADAIDMAVATRGGRVAGVVFHSDRGSVYTSKAFGQLCDTHGITQSMGATGVCWDNSVAESWFGTLKRELAHRRRWATRAEARRDLIRWIEGWFNARRLHSSNNYNSPIEWETLYYRRGDGLAA